MGGNTGGTGGIGGPGETGGSKHVGDPQIRNWGPWLLWYWSHGGEDWDIGKPINQVALGLAINELAAKVGDDAARKAIKSAAAGVVAKNAQSIAN